jgi:hypothetical protein
MERVSWSAALQSRILASVPATSVAVSGTGVLAPGGIEQLAAVLFHAEALRR